LLIIEISGEKMASIPMLDQFYVSRGLNSVTGKAFGVAIDFDDPKTTTSGQKTVLELVSISSSRELTDSLNVSASASFKKGLGGISAEFSLVQSRQFNDYYTYALVRVFVTNPPLILRNPRLKTDAQDLLVNKGWDAFTAAYGWEYIEGYVTGGSYYALIEIQTTNETQKRDIKASLSGFYGPFNAATSLESKFKEVVKNTTTNIFVVQSGGDGDIIEVSLDDMIAQAKNFPAVAKGDPVPIIAITSDYQSTVSLPTIPTPNSLIRVQQKNTLQDLGRYYLSLRDYKSNLEFILERLTEFDDFRSLDASQLNVKRQEYQTSLKETADKIDEIVRHANDCTEDFNQCKTFVSDVVFLPLPKIGGDLMTLKQLEESLAALQVEINSLKTQTDNAQNTANDAVNRANSAQNTANDAVNGANNAQNTANDAVNRANDASVWNKKIALKSVHGGYLSDRNDDGGDGRFVGGLGAWEKFTVIRS
jgi:Alanine-zipper, major outer membrane lipoprotein